MIGVTVASQFVAAQPWFGTLSEDFQERVLSGVSTLAGDKSTVLLAAGVKPRGWYAVLSGLVKLQSCSAEGDLSVFLGVPAGEWFGEGTVLKGEDRRYDVIALRETEILCLPNALVNELRLTSLPFNYSLVSHMNRRLGQAMAIIESGRIRSPEQRVALYLGRLFWDGLRRIRLTQEDLANLVGLSRQTVNKALHGLARRGFVMIEFGRVTVLDEAGLAQFSSRKATDQLP